jgi:IS30 family transposase
MKTPEEVTAMARLKSLGWGVRRIAAELGCSKNTVKRWIREGDWRRCSTVSRSDTLVVVPGIDPADMRPQRLP